MPDHLLLQLSDIHLCARGALRNGARTGEAFEATLAYLGRSGIRPDVIVVSGDLTDDGDGERYEELRVRLTPLAEKSGADVLFLPGNHDHRGRMRERLLGADGADETPLNQVLLRDGLRLVALDSTVPGKDHGELAPETLEFLEEALAEHAPDGTVVALHHPPIPSPIAPMAKLALRDPGVLARALAGTDVRCILAGHNHHAAAGSLDGVPVFVAPAVAYRADVASTDVFHPLPGSAVARIDVPARAAPFMAVIHVPASTGATG